MNLLLLKGNLVFDFQAYNSAGRKNTLLVDWWMDVYFIMSVKLKIAQLKRLQVKQSVTLQWFGAAELGRPTGLHLFLPILFFVA